MKIIEPTYEILSAPDRKLAYSLIETAGRTCYKSEPSGDPEGFIRRIINNCHLSVIEHVSITVKIVCDRGVSHELVRHRLASFSQESTRYANYSKNKFGREITVIRPLFWQIGTLEYEQWEDACRIAEGAYMSLLDLGAKPEEARAVIPNSLATDIVITANFREWMHIFKLRCSLKAHPQMREIMYPLAGEFRRRYPAIFGGDDDDN